VILSHDSRSCREHKMDSVHPSAAYIRDDMADTGIEQRPG